MSALVQLNRLGLDEDQLPMAEPSDAEKQLAWVLYSSAIRQGKDGGVKKIFQQFGFIPSPLDFKRTESLGTDRFFPASLLAQAVLWNRIEDFVFLVKNGPSGTKDLLHTLKRGIQLHYRESTCEDCLETVARSRWAPVASALAYDNPRALAALIDDPEWGPLLLDSEPKARPNGDVQDFCRQDNCVLEPSLIYQALMSQSGNCLALLSSLPEYSDVFYNSLAGSWDSNALDIQDPQNMFEEFGQPAIAPISVLMRALNNCISSTYNEKDRAKKIKGFRVAMDTVFRRVQEGSLMPALQQGTDMNWADQFAAHGCTRKIKDAMEDDWIRWIGACMSLGMDCSGALSGCKNLLPEKDFALLEKALLNTALPKKSVKKKSMLL